MALFGRNKNKDAASEKLSNQQSFSPLLSNILETYQNYLSDKAIAKSPDARKQLIRLPEEKLYKLWEDCLSDPPKLL